VTDFNFTKVIKATRKPHQCEQCGTTIKVGSTAHHVVGSYYRDFYSYRVHPECEAAGIAYAKMTGCWGEDFMWFQHCLEERDDKLWLLEHHPIVAERLGLFEWQAAEEAEAAE